VADQGIIHADIKEAAHGVRHLANDVARGDLDGVPTIEEVEDVLVVRKRFWLRSSTGQRGLHGSGATRGCENR